MAGTASAGRRESNQRARASIVGASSKSWRNEILVPKADPMDALACVMNSESNPSSRNVACGSSSAMPLRLVSSSTTRDWILSRLVVRPAGSGLSRLDHLRNWRAGRSSAARSPAPRRRRRARSNGGHDRRDTSGAARVGGARRSAGRPGPLELLPPRACRSRLRKNASSGVVSDGWGSVATTTWPSVRAGCCLANPLRTWPGPISTTIFGSPARTVARPSTNLTVFRRCATQ